MSPSDQIDAELTEALRARELRVTPQRLLIHRALRELDRHSTAEEVLAHVSGRLPNASLPTVYATLDLLGELGFARKISAGGGPALYDPRREEHHHFVCRSCGAVSDLDTSLDAAPVLRAARRRGFRPDGAELVVTGLCEECARAG
jgi:Fe2+ or Zn2+ uptake regulation protein